MPITDSERAALVERVRSALSDVFPEGAISNVQLEDEGHTDTTTAVHVEIALVMNVANCATQANLLMSAHEWRNAMQSFV